MTPLPRPSASPLPSFCVVPTRHSLSFAETTKAVLRWIPGRQPRQTARERQLEALTIERLAQELDEGDGKEERKTKGKGRDGATAT
jgi:hypothetical protein